MKFVAMLFALMLNAALAAGQSAKPLTMIQTISLPGVSGKFDHFAIDLAGKRLFVAATGNHSVEVVDFATGKVKQSLSGLGKPHGLFWNNSNQSLYIADGSQAQLVVFKSSSDAQLLPAGKLKLSDDADDLVYNEMNHLLFVGHGGSDASNPARIAVVDTDSFTLKTNIPVATHPEALDIDLGGQRVFANIADSNEIVLLNGSGTSVTARWKLENAGHNVPLAYDAKDHVIYVACRTPATLLALDATTGKEISRVSSGEGADDLFYDADLRRLYLISGAGEVDVYEVGARATLHPLDVLHTSAGAKTALFVPSQSRLYVGVPGVGSRPSEIRVYSTITKPSTVEGH